MDNEANKQQSQDSNKDNHIYSSSNSTSPQEETNLKSHLINKIIEISNQCSSETIGLSTKFLESILSQDMLSFITICANGFPDELKLLRSLAWKINLGFLPIEENKWAEILKKKRREYAAIKTIMLTKILKEKQKWEAIKNNPDALKKFQSSQAKLIEDIERDLDRTQMRFPSFYQPTDDNIKYTTEEIELSIQDRKKFKLYNINDEYKVGKEETHADIIARLLFTYANYYPDVYYNQGMNEILCPIYYCYLNDKLYLDKEDINIEADAFWSFFEIMEQLKHVFIREEDNNVNGIALKATNLSKMLNIIDKELSDYFASINVQFYFFSYRWFMLFFAQDFQLESVMQLWDLFFVKSNKFYYVYYFAIALIEMKRGILITMDQIDILTELQNFNGLNVTTVIQLALKLQLHYKVQIDPIIR